MKKNSKGFTLIELLVVVAIIGILAAVGVVAYSGYVAGAKKSASKSHQAQVVKLVAGKLKKCDLGDANVFKKVSDPTKVFMSCDDKKTVKKVGAALVAMLVDANGKAEFSNPFKTSENAIHADTEFKSGDCKADGDNIGRTGIKHNPGTKITISTCFEDGVDPVINVITVE